jgi:hypothetical protein
MTDKEIIKALQVGIRANLDKLAAIPGVCPDEEEEFADRVAQVAYAHDQDQKNTCDARAAADAEIDRRYAAAVKAGFKPDREFFVKAVIKGEKS